MKMAMEAITIQWMANLTAKGPLLSTPNWGGGEHRLWCEPFLNANLTHLFFLPLGEETKARCSGTDVGRVEEGRTR